jgi:hypothetical protein
MVIHIDLKKFLGKMQWLANTKLFIIDSYNFMIIGIKITIYFLRILMFRYFRYFNELIYRIC